MRIRSIKPEFWRSEDISSLPLSARLTFIGLWSYVDDNGVGEYRVPSITADLFADDLARDPQETLARVSRDTRTLENSGLVVVYESGRKRLFYITNWTTHQKIDRPSKGHMYPLPPAEMVESRRNCARPSREYRETLDAGTGEQGNRGAGEQNKDMSETSSDVPVLKPKPYPDSFEEWWRTYPRHKNASKKKALDAWRKATKTINAERLLELTAAYAANPGVDEVRLIPHPTTWLNEQRWESIDDQDRHLPHLPSKKTGWDFGEVHQPMILDAEPISWEIAQ